MVVKKEGILVSTTETIPGHEIDSYIGMVWGTSVRAKFIGHDILAVFKTLIGGEVEPYTKMANEAKLNVIKKVVQNAKKIGADAVIGLRMGSSQVIPGTIEIFAYGTAVKLKKRRR